MKTNSYSFCASFFWGGMLLSFLLSGCLGLSFPAVIDCEEGMIKSLKKEGILLQPKKEIYVSSIPPGAAVYVDSQFVGTTPLSVHLPLKKFDTRIKIVAPGYESVSFTPWRKRLYQYNPVSVENIAWFLANTITGTLFLTPWHGYDYLCWREALDYDFSPQTYNVYLIEK